MQFLPATPSHMGRYIPLGVLACVLFFTMGAITPLLAKEETDADARMQAIDFGPVPSSTAEGEDEVLSLPVSPAAPAAAFTAQPGNRPVTSSTPLPKVPSFTPNPKLAEGQHRSVPSIWERIKSGFTMPEVQSELVRTQEQRYASQPEYIARMVARASRYLFHIVQELEGRQMPTELALLPFIESAFNPQATSRARASGMWQFIPSTGRAYDLKQNAFRDDRRDVLASTRAAFDYLQKLYGMFGDWHLALAAYNWGEGAVGRAIEKNQRQGKETRYTDLNMPNETRYYVPKLQAIKNIVANPQAFGMELPNVQDHPYFRAAPVERDIDVALVVRLAGISLEEFRSLNPSIKRPVVLAAGTPHILLPWDSVDVFTRNLADYRGQLASWTTWSVPSPMKLELAAKKVGMNVSTMRTLNDIPRSANLIKAGSILLIHRGANVHQDVSLRVADTAQVDTMVIKPRRVAKGAKRNVARATAASKGTVKTGQTRSVAQNSKGRAVTAASHGRARNDSAQLRRRLSQNRIAGNQI